MMKIDYIGQIESPYTTEKPAPHQGFQSLQVSKLMLKEEYLDAAKELKEGDLIQVLYFASKAKRHLRSTPPHGDGKEKGVFSLRSPGRPNPINVTIGKILSIEGNTLQVVGLDALDGSPLLDIKIYSTTYHHKLLPQELLSYRP